MLKPVDVLLTNPLVLILDLLRWTICTYHHLPIVLHIVPFYHMVQCSLLTNYLSGPSFLGVAGDPG